ncbi:hypothetical protein V6N13_143882 [Hibiscus sabdariffa]
MNHVRSSEICLCTCLLLLIIDRYCSELMYDWTVSYAQRAPLGIDKQDLRASLDNEVFFSLPDGILINGLGPNRARFEFEPDTPLKLLEYFQLNDIFEYYDVINDRPTATLPSSYTFVIDAHYRDFFHIVFQNPLLEVQTWHIDGYNFFVVGMGWGLWDESKKAGYNMVDAVSRSTIQVYPLSWTAILMELDNLGTWNLRSQYAENWYLGQELYLRVKGAWEDEQSDISTRDEAPIPANVIKCGRAANL